MISLPYALCRSFLFLLACKQFYDNARDHPMPEAVREAMESSLTHNLFYLAQAYGHIGNSELSSLYCHMTLERQFAAGLEVGSGLEWTKNCMGMADFRIALGVSRGRGVLYLYPSIHPSIHLIPPPPFSPPPAALPASGALSVCHSSRHDGPLRGWRRGRRGWGVPSSSLSH